MLVLNFFWVQHLTVYSQDVSTLCCSVSLPCHAPVCHAPPSNPRLVWEAASFPTSASPPGLQLEREATQGLSSFWKFSSLQVVSPVLACNPKKWLLWRLTLHFLASYWSCMNWKHHIIKFPSGVTDCSTLSYAIVRSENWILHSSRCFLGCKKKYKVFITRNE